MMTSLDGLKAFLKKYDEVVDSRKANTDICASEFQAIKLQSAEDKKELLSLEGSKEGNKKKNRYKDILPYDYTRVILPKDKFSESSDYINANHVEVEKGEKAYIAAQGPMPHTVDDFWRMICEKRVEISVEKGKKAYIAAQGPMPHTVDDFWRMIWQFKIKMIVMGCKEVEMGKNRCHRYWAEAGKPMQFHDVLVSLVSSTSVTHNMMVRELKAEKNGTVHYVTQLHYMDWPDHGAPETSETILQLINILREKHPENDPPVLIHCSAGCGRTGAIIATDIGKKLIQSHAKDIDILTIVCRLRKQRPALVQSKEQYEFIYEVFRELVTQELQRYESQFNSDYMNINAFPVLKSDKHNPAPPPKPDLPPPKPEHPQQKVHLHPPPQKPDLPPQKPGLPPVATRLDKEKKVANYINTELSTELKREIILPTEHVVNTDGGFIRRSRSAYGKKPKSTDPKKSQSPPEVPQKENKLSSKENLTGDGPTLPPKSPGSLAKQNFFTNTPAIQSSRSVKVRGNQVPVKPKLLKKPSMDSAMMAAQEADYVTLETGRSHEDFIPAPTPVGFNQYPMRSKMSASHPVLVVNTNITSNDKRKTKTPSDSQLDDYSSNSSPRSASPSSSKLLSAGALYGSNNQDAFFYSPDHDLEKRASAAAGIFGSCSSSFDTSLVRNSTSSPNISNIMTDSSYAVVDMSKKTNRKVVSEQPVTLKEASIYETLSGTCVGGPAPPPAVAGSGGGASKRFPSVASVGAGGHDMPQERIGGIQPIKPYSVTEVGFGYNKRKDGADTATTSSSSPTSISSRADRLDGPPVPYRNKSLYPSISVEGGDYASVKIYPASETDAPPKSLPSSITWFNDKLKNLQKRVSNPVVPSVIPSEMVWSHSFEIVDKYGFPNRINIKPKGPRPPPSSWGEVITP